MEPSPIIPPLNASKDVKEQTKLDRIVQECVELLA